MGGHKKNNTAPPSAPQQQPEGFSFVVPTEFVDLPSEGRYYSQNHPLHNKDVIEIKHMTAKEEDILTSKTLLKKGVAIDRVMKNVIVDKTIDPDSLLVGDRNAIVIALRAISYGESYETKVICPSCEAKNDFTFDLSNIEVVRGGDLEELDIKENEDGTFNVILPLTKLTVTFKLLTGREEKAFISNLQQDRKTKAGEKTVTRQLMSIIVAVNEDSTHQTKRYVVDNLPSIDSRRIRTAYKIVNPNIDLTQVFECAECGFESEMEVPLTADFFWPDR